MIDDFAPPPRKKPKVIEPLPKPNYQPLPILEDEAATTSFQTPEQAAAHEGSIAATTAGIPVLSRLKSITR